MGDGAQHNLQFDGKETAILSGVMRLSSQDAYEHEFVAVQQRLATNGSLDLDLTGVRFMNSSGIRWLCVLVLEAKRVGAPISIRGTKEVAWQGKSLPGLRALYDRLAIVT